MHDWGGPVGLRTAVEARERVDRLVIMDTGIATGHQRMSEAWQAFRAFVERTEDLPVGFLVQGATATELPDAVVRAYDAPFPSPQAKAGPRAFPLLIPLTPDAPGAEAGRRTLEALRADPFPTLLLWADGDPVLPLETGERFAVALGLRGAGGRPRRLALPPGGPGRAAGAQDRRLADLRLGRQLAGLVGRLEAGLGVARAQLVALAGGRVGLEEDAVGLQDAGDALGGAARQDGRRAADRLDRLRHVHVEDAVLERVDDRVRDVLGLHDLHAACVSAVPRPSSVFTTTGQT